MIACSLATVVENCGNFCCSQLQIFNNLIQYQFEGNHHLVYIIIRRRKSFLALQKLAISPFVEATAALTEGKSLHLPIYLCCSLCHFSTFIHSLSFLFLSFPSCVTMHRVLTAHVAGQHTPDALFDPASAAPSSRASTEGEEKKPVVASTLPPEPVKEHFSVANKVL